MTASDRKSERRAAEALVLTYHEAELAGLIERVAAVLEEYHAGKIDVHDVDQLIHRYHKAGAAALEVLLPRRLGRIRGDGRSVPRAPDC